MSDDNGGAEHDDGGFADPGVGEIGDGGFDALAATSDSPAGRLDTIHGTLSTLGMRIDALVTSTTSYRAALTDRLTEYADLVSKLTRTQAADLEEYRRANERSIADLRRSLSGSDEVMERVGARLDSLLTDSESADEQSRRVLTEVRSILEAQESLSRFLTESLDQFGERVLAQISTAQAAPMEQIEALRSALEADEGEGESVEASLAPVRETLQRIEVHLADASRDERTADRLARIDERLNELAQADPSATLVGRFDEMRESLADVASGEVVGALWDEVHGLRGKVESMDVGAAPVEVEALRAEIGDLGAAVDALVRAAQSDDSSEETPPHPVLVNLSNDVAALRDEPSRGLVVEPSDALAGTVDELRADLATLDERMSVLAGIERSVTELREDGTLTAVAADIAALRARGESGSAEQLEVLREELSSLRSGVESGSAGQLEVLREELSSLRSGVESGSAGQVELLREEFSSLRSELTSLLAGLAPAPAPAPPIDEADVEGELQILRSGVETVDAEVRTMRSGIEDIIARLDEGLVLDTDASTSSAVPELADQLAAMRDLVSTEFDGLRDLVSGRPAATASPVGDTATTALDPDTLDLLRDEIRTAGAVPDDVLEALRKELIALRRRIKLRAEGEILTPAQLEIIAESVARKLAE